MLVLSLSMTKVRKFSLDKPHTIPCDPFLLLSVEFEVAISSCEVVKFWRKLRRRVSIFFVPEGYK
jgi:hypothetical protein